LARTQIIVLCAQQSSVFIGWRGSYVTCFVASLATKWQMGPANRLRPTGFNIEWFLLAHESSFSHLFAFLFLTVFY
jgi:hypothetical protein